MDCIFCKIAKGEIPSFKVYEDNSFMAFLDINPRSKGHVLVVPKDHYRWVWDVPNAGEYFEVCKKIASAQKKAFNTDLVVSLIVGEEVPHAHIWLVPRYENDGHGGAIDVTKVMKFSENEMQEFTKLIKENL